MSSLLTGVTKSNLSGTSFTETSVADHVRLPVGTIDKIRQIVHGAFPGRAQVILFGSRTRPEARGGDLDLLVIADASPDVLTRARVRAIARLQIALGEQHIDLVATSDPDRDSRLVVREALRTGVLL
jgi:predicted nucleotidyltransferase